MFCRWARAAALFCWILAGCKKAEVAPGPRVIAVLPYSNLSGDPKLDWVGEAIPPLSALRGSKITPVRSAGEAAVVAHELWHGVVERDAARFRLRIQVEDLSTHQLRPGPVCGGATVMELIDCATRGPDPLPTQSEEALRAFAAGEFEKSVLADPQFASAWVIWAERSLQSGRTDLAREVVRKAGASGARFTARDSARLEVADARAAGDSARLTAAQVRLADALPAEAQPQADAANLLVAQRRFDEGVKRWQKATALPGNRPDYWNLLGYAYLYQGKLEDALQAFKTYEQKAPQSPNPPDSRGEAYLRTGRFAEAVAAFEESIRKDASFNQGHALHKAAVARLWARDGAAAETLEKRYLDALREKNPVLARVEEAGWLFDTGRGAQAKERLEKIASEQPALKPAIQARLLVWEAEQGRAPSGANELLRALADPVRGLEFWRQAYARSAPQNEDLSREYLIAGLLGSGREEEARKLATAWPVPAAGASLSSPSLTRLALLTRHRLGIK